MVDKVFLVCPALRFADSPTHRFGFSIAGGEIDHKCVNKFRVAADENVMD